MEVALPAQLDKDVRPWVFKIIEVKSKASVQPSNYFAWLDSPAFKRLAFVIATLGGIAMLINFFQSQGDRSAEARDGHITSLSKDYHGSEEAHDTRVKEINDVVEDALIPLGTQLGDIQTSLKVQSAQIAGLDDSNKDIASRLNSIEQDLRASAKLQEFASATPDQLLASAGDLNEVLRLIVSAGLIPDPQQLQAIRTSLSRVTSEQPPPEYWQASSRIVSLESQIRTSGMQKTGRKTSGAQLNGTVSRGNHYVGGEITLDGGTWMGDVFQDAVIIYNGGPVIVYQSRFINCRFVIRIDNQPTANAKDFIVRILGADDLTRFVS